MSKTVVMVSKHPYIEECVEIWGGRPIIKGTSTSVKNIVGYYKLGMSVEEIIEGLPHLSPAQVYDALSYYHDYQEKIEYEIQENRIENVMRKHNLQMDRNGRLTFKDT